MSFCCGASMIGALGSLRHYKTQIHNVPILYCPVCNRIDVHADISEEYELLAEYAHEDFAPEVDFRDFVSNETMKQVFENCISIDQGNITEVYHSQIDNALDLLAVAKELNDREWESTLKHRLRKLSRRLRRLEAQTKRTH